MGGIEALVRPLVSLIAAAGMPLVTGRLLARLYLPGLPVGGDERARRLVPFRRAAFVTGLAQVQLGWMLGVTALGPASVTQRYGWAAFGFGALCAVAAFVTGGIARRAEEPHSFRAPATGVALTRLRVVPWFVGPLAVGLAAARMPVLAGGHVRWSWAATSLGICGLGVAYAGLLSAVVTRAVHPATDAVRTLARDAARRVGAPIPFTLRLPTHGAHLANAAALPWARTIIVSDAAAELLPSEQLKAVLAHEAAHLDEPPVVGLARLGAATSVLFAAVVGPRFTPHAPLWIVLGSALVLAVALLGGIQKLARRMEERADARARDTIGSVALAEALRRLHAYAQMPLSTGRSRRTHPDLYDRLVQLGIDPGPRPPPPPRGGLPLGIALAVVLVVLPLGLHAATELRTNRPSAVSVEHARIRLFVAPWDRHALLARGWHARRDGRLDDARRWLQTAERAGPTGARYWELAAEIAATSGDCAHARKVFARAVESRAAAVADDVLTRDMDLHGYHLPPTYVRRCAPTP